MSEKVINREASDKTKGFRLQKLRAIRLMLETLVKDDKAIFYTAIETVEDVSHTTVSGEQEEKYYEEDKNYDENHKFTIFSPEVKNTLVSFYDIFVGSWRSADEIRLGFYTTAGYGKERKKFELDSAKIDPPDDPMLGTLCSCSILPDNIVRMVKSVVLEEYKQQYSKKTSKGNLATLEAMSIDNFRDFLGKIHWFFESEDEKSLKDTVIGLIQNSKLHNVRLANKEEAVFALLMEKLDEQQGESSLARRVLFASDVKLIFKQAESEESSLAEDPTWTELKRLEQQITDKRNLSEKITSVCPAYTDKKLKHLARLACRSKTEQSSSNRTFLSLKYRVFEACSEYLSKEESAPASEMDVDNVIDALKKLSNQHVDELKKDYTYTISNQQAISGIIMDLFDGCFVSFDEVADEK